MTGTGGLSAGEVQLSRQLHGSNRLEKQSGSPLLSRFLEGFSDPIIRILLIALCINIVFMLRGAPWFETAGIAAAELYLYWTYDVVGHFALAAHCADTGAAVSGGDGGTLRVLAVDSNRQILLCRHACRYLLSLVQLLFPDAVHSASMRAGRALTGKARKLSASQMDEPPLYSNHVASAAGADE